MSQILATRYELSTKIATLEAPFARLEYRIGSEIEMSHELMHILLWEPFFVGHFKPHSAAEFANTGILFEAFCFFFSDILLTPTIRERYPDQELVFSRHAVSMRHFQPYRAFRALGIKDCRRILQTYLLAFSLRHSDVSLSNAPVARELQLRFATMAFYADVPARRTLKHLADNLVFDEFYNRFCRVPGLPTLVSEDSSHRLKEGDVKGYLHQIHECELARWKAIPLGLSRSVRLRRAVQTRAYFALQLRRIIERDEVRSLTGSRRHPATILPQLEEYLSSLEYAIESLKLSSIRQADAFYEKYVRAFLVRTRAWVSRRDFIFPPLESPRVCIRGAKSELLGSCRLLVGVLCGKRAAGVKTAEYLLEELLEIQALLKERGLSRGLRRRYERFLYCDDVRKLWSVPLSFNSPAANRFRELSFVFS
ncbi:MAG: hypothetical protein ACKVP3_07525 [Hyphomicrobiaceae bacterium]